MYTLTKDFRFEAAHRLAKGYVGKCANIHGHSWNGTIAIECDKLDDKDMGVDYASIGVFLKTKVEEHLDHKFFIFVEDEISALLKGQGYGTILFDSNPTSEVLAKYIYNMAVKFFKERHPRAHVAWVTIKETCTTSCTYNEKLTINI